MIRRNPSSARSPLRRTQLALIAASTLLFGLVTWRAATSVEPDYELHADWARQLAETGRIGLPHPLFHLLTVAVHALLPLPLAAWMPRDLTGSLEGNSYLLAAMLVGTGAWVALALLLQHRLLQGSSDPGERPAWAAAAAGLALMLLGPITFLTWGRHQLYLGYIAPNVFHNPTMALVKPLALAWFWRVTRPAASDEKAWLVAGGLAAAATLAKPSFTVALLPALVAWLVFSPRLPRAVDRGAALASVLVGGAILALQASGHSGQPSLLVVAPLRVMGFYSKPWQMPFLLLLSIAFPASVALAFPRARRHGPLLLAWLAFAVAAAYGYLLAEAEPNSGDGNWLWSGQVALFVLLVESLVFFVSRADGARVSPPARARRLAAALLGLQLVCGLAWYAAEVIQPHAWWFPFEQSDG